ncbi:MAG: hypothetical protein OXG35_29770 [Acidobacteria bacterium]|nr:hypothetical protein [Acidobacteriota bacterium]
MLFWHRCSLCTTQIHPGACTCRRRRTPSAAVFTPPSRRVRYVNHLNSFNPFTRLRIAELGRSVYVGTEMGF